MALFRQNLNSGMNFLRRHFSSDDLYQDRDDVQASSTPTNDSHHRMNLPGRKPLPSGPSFPTLSSVEQAADILCAQANSASYPQWDGLPTLSSVQDMTRGILSQAAAAASSVTDAVKSGAVGVGTGGGGVTSANVTPPPRRVMENKDHAKILLVIDDKHNDWSVNWPRLSFSFFSVNFISTKWQHNIQEYTCNNLTVI